LEVGHVVADDWMEKRTINPMKSPQTQQFNFINYTQMQQKSLVLWPYSLSQVEKQGM